MSIPATKASDSNGQEEERLGCFEELEELEQHVRRVKKKCNKQMYWERVGVLIIST